MIDRVLVPMDGSAMAEKALDYACTVHRDAEITVLTVVGVPTLHMGEAAGLSLADDLDAAAMEIASPIFASAAELAGKYQHDITTMVRLGRPSRAICREASNHDVVVIGAHGRDFTSRLLLGNIAELVTKRSPVPVTVVR